MYCAKLTLIDRRYNTNTTAKSKHATGFKRNCLMNEWGCDGGAIASRTIVMDSLRNRFATHDEHDQGEEKDDKKFDSDASLSCWSRERDCGEKTRRRITTRSHTKTPLVVTTTTLDLPDDVKGQHVPALSSLKDRTFRVPHNYQQYQQTLLSRTSTTDPSESICVLGEKIESQCKPKRSADSAQKNDPETRSQGPKNFQMMNALGETNISFYDFQRTWSIKDYDFEGDDDGEASPTRNRRMSSNDATRNNRMLSGRHNRGINRPPSPQTKQIIRVNVVKVANS